MPALIRRQEPALFRGRQALLWPALLGLVVLWLSAVLLEGPVMEREIAGDVEQRLLSAGYGRIQAAVSGRDVTLGGEVSGRRAARDAAFRVTAVAGVRRVRDATADAPLSLSWLRASRNGIAGWNLSGRLPDGMSRERVLEAFGSPDGSHAASLVFDVETADAPWLPAVDELLVLISVLDGAAVEVGAGSLEVAGKLSEPDRYAGLVEALESLGEARGLRFVNRIATFPDTPSGRP